MPPFHACVRMARSSLGAGGYGAYLRGRADLHSPTPAPGNDQESWAEAGTASFWGISTSLCLGRECWPVSALNTWTTSPTLTYLFDCHDWLWLKDVVVGGLQIWSRTAIFLFC